MEVIKKVLLLALYPVAAVFLVAPHVVGHLFHTRHQLYFILLGAIVATFSGYAGYMQLWDGDDSIIDFQIFCLAAALYCPFHFLITAPFQDIFEEFHQRMLTGIVGPQQKG